MKDSTVQTIAILLIFIVERIISHRYLLQQNKIQKLNNFLSQHYQIVDVFFEDLEQEIDKSLDELSKVPNGGQAYENLLAASLDRIKTLNSKFHSAIIIPISTIEKSKYRTLTEYSNDFIDNTSKTLEPSEKILAIKENRTFEEKINFYKSRIFRTLHS
ncbi:hypothetical protein V6B16_13660 [Salinimicrobium catena]|uniref:hypothetical protein n=1 Tax=Salinimicrobium catena TaxID=390640 RepID=UPI002FE4A2BF